jgi:PadR family transcriptional regulator
MKSEHLGEFEELILLCVCTLGDEATGARIQAAMEREADRRASLGSIYAALDRMARKGAVESWLGEPLPERGGRARRHYRATASGRAALSGLHRVRARLIRRAGLAPSRRT